MSKMLDPKDIISIANRATALHTESEVDKALDSMAREISFDLYQSNPIVLCVMVGGIIPTGKLLTRLDFPLQVDYVHATRYGDEFVGQELEWLVKPRGSLEDRTVLIVDDILDGGLTLAGIADFCKQQGAKEVKTAVLVEKDVPRYGKAIKKADYTGVTVADKFVFGYGMDYKRYLRNAPGIFAVSEEDE